MRQTALWIQTGSAPGLGGAEIREFQTLARPSDPHMSPGKGLESREGATGGLRTVLRAENSPGPRRHRLKGRARERRIDQICSNPEACE